MSLSAYCRKMGGTTRGSPPRVSNAEIAWSWVGAFLGIAAAGLASRAFFEALVLTLMIGSLGASAVLVYGAPRSPLAQPRNLVGGQVLSALVGVACWKLLHPFPWLAAALAVATAIAVRHATRTTAVHPALLHEPDWVYAADGDPPVCAQTRGRLLPELVDRDVLVACGHYPGTGIGRIVTRDGHVVWEALE